MKNYKLYLWQAIEETASDRDILNEYSQDFINDRDATKSGYICDLISKFADNNTSIYYSEIANFIRNNLDEVTDAINEFGWDGCGGDLYKAGQMAEYMAIEKEIYNELEDVIKWIALDFIDSTDEANDDAERIFETLTDEEKDELTSEFIEGIEKIDNNDRLCEIETFYNAFVQSILDKADDESDDNEGGRA